MYLSLLLLSVVGVWAEPFLYLHPSNPEFHSRDLFPQQRTAPRGKIRDLPQSGIVYLHRIKPMDPFVKAFGSANEDRKKPLELVQSHLHEAETLPKITFPPVEAEEPAPTTQRRLSTTTEVTPADLSNADVDALDDILDSFKSETVDFKTGQEERKPPRLVALRGTRVAGSASAKRRPYARQVKLETFGATATLKSGVEFDPWERMGQ